MISCVVLKLTRQNIFFSLISGTEFNHFWNCFGKSKGAQFRMFNSICEVKTSLFQWLSSMRTFTLAACSDTSSETQGLLAGTMRHFGRAIFSGESLLQELVSPWELKGCVSLRKSKIGFLNPKESENGFCVSLLDRSFQDLSDHCASKELKNPLPEWILRFL